MRYTLMMLFPSNDGPCATWLSDGKSGHSTTASLTNVGWFTSASDPTIEEWKLKLLELYGPNAGFKVVDEEELKAHVVLRTIHESTFARP